MKGGVEFIANNESLREAVNMWCDNTSHDKALERYGPINDWDTSAVTNMEYLFEGKINFNENISKWNTMAVTNMEAMFSLAQKFNQPIGNWDTSNVIDIDYIFMEDSYNKDRCKNWNLTNVIRY